MSRGTSTWEPSFEEVFDLSLDLLCIGGLDGRFKRVNPAFEQAFGYSSEELLSRPFLDFVHPEDRARSRGAFEQLIRGEEVILFENRNVCADGSTLWLEWSGRPVPKEDIFYGSARDVTDRKRAENGLRRARKTMEASRDELRQLVEEQAALRRVATLVARGVPPAEVLDAVCEEVDRLLAADSTRMLRHEPDGTATVLATHGEIGELTPAGTRLKLEGEQTAAALVLRTGRPARVANYEGAPGSMAARVHALGFRNGVAAPISVEGRVWGVIASGWKQHEPPVAQAENRMAGFTELVATAIANADSRAELRQLADEQAALQRVATLVARGVSPTEVLDAVAAEVARLLGADWGGVHHYGPDGLVTILASRGKLASDIPVGARRTLDSEGVVASVLKTGRSCRMEVNEDESRSWAIRGRELGIRCMVAAPIVVEGRPWGVMAAIWTREDALPADDVEVRMAGFTELVGTAIANADSRGELRVRVEQQVALRRVATLGARGVVAPTDVLDAVAEEVRSLLDADFASLMRNDGDDATTIVASRGDIARRLPVGTRIPIGGEDATSKVLQTGRPARMETFADASGAIADLARELGVRSSVAAPITVEGRLWGVVGATWTRDKPLPADDAEERMGEFAELVATAVANAESQAKLSASRARVVAATAEERQRVVRDLHDGAQQRLVHAVINLKLALREQGPGNEPLHELLVEALGHAEQANSELRELAHGILPAVLTSGGLRAGAEALVSRCSLPVAVDVSRERLPTAIEATAYFVVSEALTNAVKHSGASRAEVRARVDDGLLRVEIRDDGVGGADASQGSGLIGLRDRVEALGGTIEIASPRGSGTSVLVDIPIKSA
jgi:PAS domain S-box-containing protein